MALQASTGADAHQGEAAEGGAFGASGKVDIGQSIEFVDHDVDVVAPDTRGNHCETLAFVSSGHGAELAALDFALAMLEV